MLKHNFPIVFFLYGLIQQHGFFYDFSCLLWCFLYDFPTFFCHRKSCSPHFSMGFPMFFSVVFLWLSHHFPMVFPGSPRFPTQKTTEISGGRRGGDAAVHPAGAAQWAAAQRTTTAARESTGEGAGKL